MAEGSDLEKTEPPSGRRLEQARSDGQVPRSHEVGAFLILASSATIFWVVGPWIAHRVAGVVRRGLTLEESLARNPDAMLIRFADLVFDTMISLSPLFFALLLAVFAPPFIMRSWNFSIKVIVPDLDRLNPVSGLGRLVSLNGLVQLVKSILKTLLVGGIALWVIWNERSDIFALFGQSIGTGLVSAGHLIIYSFFAIVLSIILIVAIDVPYQLWAYYDKLKMTKDEVKQENKEMEGSPEVKGKIRQLQREVSRRRMMSAVPSADVIVTNPTHFSVALSYKAGMGAPKVVAKGRGEIALKIREIALAHNVPLLEAPPLARALYRHTEIDREVPSTLYTAVAEVLAYVYQLARWRQTGGNYPLPPRTIAVPPELVPEVVNG
ncbi:MAG: flagellar type III secretion system protein FlhB [Candidatus Accumulibacter sp.]|jgi:flagellar biosynthetic protein FlhB|nr:flagellar type III secretion system protein FlhB [Accumulibacter sp.]